MTRKGYNYPILTKCVRIKFDVQHENRFYRANAGQRGALSFINRQVYLDSTRNMNEFHDSLNTGALWDV
jgi:hypothetical protein